MLKQWLVIDHEADLAQCDRVAHVIRMSFRRLARTCDSWFGGPGRYLGQHMGPSSTLGTRIRGKNSVLMAVILGGRTEEALVWFCSFWRCDFELDGG